jgi:DedD protein
MAGNGRRGAGERVLESRHLVGLFLGVVLLCGVFFTLGYVMGHNQYGGSVHASTDITEVAPHPVRATPKPESASGPTPPANNEWDFYSKSNDTHLSPATNSPSHAVASQPAKQPVVETHPAPVGPVEPAPTAKPTLTAARFQPPKVLKGSLVLQVAALTHENDALAIADELQQKQFPSFVVTPSADNLYRVQVGPYPDEHAAESAKDSLEHAGFKAIIKR